MIKQRYCMAAWAICLSLLLGSCQGERAQLAPPAEDGENSQAMGRYVEEEIPFPEEIGIVIGGIQRDTQGALHLLATANPDRIVGPWSLYLSEDEGDSWTKQEAPWLEQFEGATVSGVGFDGDGGVYLATITYPPEFDDMVQEAMETGEMPDEELYPPYLLYHADASGEVRQLDFDFKTGEDGKVTLREIRVAKNGDLIIQHADSFVQYDPATGEQKHEFLASGWGDTLLYGDTFAVVGDTEIQQFDLDSGETLEPIPLDSGGDGTFVISQDESSLYRCSGEGIFRFVLGGSVWERVVDGELSSLNMPSVYISSLIDRSDGGFWVLTSSGGSYIPLRFAFDESIPTVPDSELRVFSLWDNETLRQAIGLFQRSNTETRVRFQIAVDGQSAITVSDAIRSLNTELLAGKGPDLLVLDGLPVDSYIEKGVLADLSAVLSPAIQEGRLLENIVSAFEQDGKIPAVPARFGVPQMWGPDAFVASARDLHSMADWIEKDAAENPGVRQLYRMEPEELIEDFYATCAPAWRNEDGSIRREEFISFLEDIQRIANTATEPQMDAMFGQSPFSEPFSFLYGGIFYANRALRIVSGLSQTADDLASPEAAARYLEDGSFALMAGQAQNVFVPQTILGINQNSSQAEKAQELLMLTLSQKVQENDFEDGYPVDIAALEAGAQSPYAPGDDGMQAPVMEDGEMKLLFILWPEEAFMDQVIETIRGLSTPSIPDEVLLEMIIEETRDFFAGSKTAQETADAVAERTQAYLAE